LFNGVLVKWFFNTDWLIRIRTELFKGVKMKKIWVVFVLSVFIAACTSGVSPTNYNGFGQAIKNGKGKTVAKYLDAGMDVDVRLIPKFSGAGSVYVIDESEVLMTPLMYAAFDGNAEICRILIDAGANVDAQDKFGGTALMHAIFGNGHDDNKAEIVTLLVNSGADTRIKNHDGRTAYDLAGDKLKSLLKG